MEYDDSLDRSSEAGRRRAIVRRLGDRFVALGKPIEENAELDRLMGDWIEGKADTAKTVKLILSHRGPTRPANILPPTQDDPPLEIVTPEDGLLSELEKMIGIHELEPKVNGQ